MLIHTVSSVERTFVSNVFTRDKPDGSVKIILDLTHFNTFIDTLKWTTFKLLLIMSKGCYMASIDWRDAYYTVPVAEGFRKFLVFKWNNTSYQYTCLPNGLACAPRYFSKLPKVLFSEMRKRSVKHSCRYLNQV